MAQPIPAEDDLELDETMIAPVDAPQSGRERRMNIRAYNYWLSLLRDRPFPAVADLEPEAIEPFRDNSILLDFTQGADAPVLRYIGKSLRDECGLRSSTVRPEDVPGKSLLSRLTDHYLEIIANRAPIGFEAEFVNARGNMTMYRGILMPMSDNGEAINFIYGVISWKEVAPEAMIQQVQAELEELSLEPAPEDAGGAELALTEFAPDDDVLELTTDALEEGTLALEDPAAPDEPLDLAGPELAGGQTSGIDASLAAGAEDDLELDLSSDLSIRLQDLLMLAQETAATASAVDKRSRASLYEALAMAYDFHAEAEGHPEHYLALLEVNGLTQQERAPYTPTVKLVFGAHYDKARLTEYAAALSYAGREHVPPGEFREFVDRFEGGLKGLVRAERLARSAGRNAPRALTGVERARNKLRKAAIMAPVEINGEDEFIVLVARRRKDGTGYDVVSVVPDGTAAMEKALKHKPA